MLMQIASEASASLKSISYHSRLRNKRLRVLLLAFLCLALAGCGTWTPFLRPYESPFTSIEEMTVIVPESDISMALLASHTDGHPEHSVPARFLSMSDDVFPCGRPTEQALGTRICGIRGQPGEPPSEALLQTGLFIVPPGAYTLTFVFHSESANIGFGGEMSKTITYSRPISIPFILQAGKVYHYYSDAPEDLFAPKLEEVGTIAEYVTLKPQLRTYMATAPWLDKGGKLHRPPEINGTVAK